MRILLCLESYLPNISGVVIFTKRLATFLSGQRHRVEILTTSPSGWPLEENDPADFTIRRVRGWRNPFRRDLRISYPWDRKEIRRVVAALSPDIVHTQDVGVLCQMVRREANRLKIPVIAHHHFSMEFALSYVRPPFLRPFVKPIVIRAARRHYNRCQLVITPTEFSKRGVASWGIETPIVAVSNGVELDRFRPLGAAKPPRAFQERFGIRARRDSVLYAGRLDKDKNIWTLIRAIPLVLKRLPDTEFFFVGEGTERSRIESWLQRQAWRDRVHLVGFVAHEDPALVLFNQLSDVAWTASPIETQSLTTLEAMACGLPVVAANAGALPELVHEGENGFLVDPYDAKGFADAVLQILRDRDLAKKFSKKSAEIASRHNVAESLTRIFALYRQVIGEEEHPV
jgi:glycosyltransferase involved in cell wall biosynthesis